MVRVVSIEDFNKDLNYNFLSRRIISKVADPVGDLKKELSSTKHRIKAINEYISSKYLLLLLKNESNQELDELKSELMELIEKETKLEEEIKNYE